MSSIDHFLSSFFIDPTTLPHTPTGFIQLLILLCAYGYVLFCGSNMISDGSELLLFIPSIAGIVGSVVLPILGAVPDGAMILFSGLGPDAKEQVKVGVGALAGSTIMLLTVPWTLSILAGRVSLDDHGRGAYKDKPKLRPEDEWSLTRSGVNVTPSVKTTARIMIATSLTYFIIQGPAFAYDCGEGTSCAHTRQQHWFALTGLIICGICFVGYLIYQVKTQDTKERHDVLVEKLHQGIKNGDVSVVAAFADLIKEKASHAAATGMSSETLLGQSEVKRELRDTLRFFFDRYDTSADGLIDERELGYLLRDLGERMPPDEMDAHFRSMDKNNDSYIDFDEFVHGMEKYIVNRASYGNTAVPRFATPAPSRAIPSALSTRREQALQSRSMSRRGNVPGLSPMSDSSTLPVAQRSVNGQVEVAIPEEQRLIRDESDDESEEEEMPEDLQDLPVHVQQRKIKMRAGWMMTVGTLLVLFFSDPMVNVLSELGARIHVPPFFVAFVLAPVASNASELIASYNYASKKTTKTITISFATLEGAACMNNTFCLGIFLMIVFAKELAWEFAAETLSIVVVQVIVGIIAQKRTHRLVDGIIVAAMYPLSIVLVIVLERIGLN